MAAAPASACNLGHCPRPKPALKENPTLGFYVDHADAVDGDPASAFTQVSLHARLPLGNHWALGGHLPLGYLQGPVRDRWGLGNPMAYAEWLARPAAAHALSLGAQVEIPAGNAETGVASEHAMIMPYSAYAFRGTRAVFNASLGLSAQISGDHAHGHGDGVGAEAAAAEGTAMHAGHVGHEEHAAGGLPASTTAARDLPVQANPHAPYEFLYRFSLALPLVLPFAKLPVEPEVGLSGIRVLGPEEDSPGDFLGVEGAMGFRLARTLLLKPRWERQLTHSSRFAWKTGVELKVDLRR